MSENRTTVQEELDINASRWTISLHFFHQELLSVLYPSRELNILDKTVNNSPVEITRTKGGRIQKQKLRLQI